MTLIDAVKQAQTYMAWEASPTRIALSTSRHGRPSGYETVDGETRIRDAIVSPLDLAEAHRVRSELLALGLSLTLEVEAERVTLTVESP